MSENKHSLKESLSHVTSEYELEGRIRKAFGGFDIVIHPEPAGLHEPENKVSKYEEAKQAAVGD